MLKPLSTTDFDVVIDLLVEGFPDRSQAFWRKALTNLQRSGGADYPLGFLLVDKETAVGVVLTPSSLRRRADGALQRIVNLSSWYVRPEHRWRSGPMLRSIIADSNMLYLDLTPTERVRQMLPALGFAPINAGVELAFLPVVALTGGRSGVVRPAVMSEWPSACGPDWSMIEEHRQFGCEPLLVDGPAGATQVVCQIVRFWGVRVAKLVYVGSYEKLRPVMGRLARYLLGRGCFFLRLPARDAAVGFGSLFLPRGVWYAKGDDFADRADVLGSELILFDL